MGAGVAAAAMLACDNAAPGCAVTTSLPDTLQINVNEDFLLNPAARDCNGDPVGPVTYLANHPTIATITVQGLVQATGAGVTTIDVTAPGLAESVTVEVFGYPILGTSVDLPLTDTPLGIAVSRLGVVYVTQHGANTLARAASPTGPFQGSVTVGNAPSDVIFNSAGGLAYVANGSSRSVSVVDVATHLEILDMPLAYSPLRLALSPDGAELYVTSDSGMVFRLSTLTHAVTDSFQVGAASHGIAFSPDGGRVFLSVQGAVMVYSPAADSIVDTLVTGGMPGQLVVSGDGGRLYVANEVIGLDLWNLGTMDRITSVGLPGAYGIALSPDDSTLFISVPSAQYNVIVASAATGNVFGFLPLGGTPRDIAFDRYGRFALITNEAGYVSVYR